jgi:phenylacetate-CoA oxygenase PaaJ subunit
VREQGAALDVVLTPTYSGCPATEVISQSVVDAITAAGLGPVTITMQRAPAWTTDWISDAGRRKLRDYGIAPPSGNAAVHDDGPRPITSTPAAWTATRGNRPKAVGLRVDRLQGAVPLPGCRSL